MKIEQIYTGCLAQGAYYIVSEGEAAIIDPLREPTPYLNRLKRDNVKLKYIFETHFHADFVSGHLDLSKHTDAPIIFGPNAHPTFDFISAGDGQVFNIGKFTIQVLHTPGHTMESTCYLLKDENGVEQALFSGDTLFLGDVGRPDLAQKSANMDQRDLAGLLYDSLTKKILPLPDHIIVYPAHGAGSACGKNMSKETMDTLGNQKKVNYALNQPTKEAFIEEVLEGLLPPPPYFKMNVEMNKNGYESIEQVMNTGLKGFDPEEFEALASNLNALILDTRNNSDFYKAFIPNSINIGLNGDFAPWVGTLLAHIRQPILLVIDEGKEEEAVTRLARVGFDNSCGYLKGGIAAWEKQGFELDAINRIKANQFLEEIQESQKDHIFDIRKESEFDAGHLNNAINYTLSDINDWINEISSDKHFYIHCAGGYRSMIAASILQARGYRNFTEIEGGYGAIKNAIMPIEKL